MTEVMQKRSGNTAYLDYTVRDLPNYMDPKIALFYALHRVKMSKVSVLNQVDLEVTEADNGFDVEILFLTESR